MIEQMVDGLAARLKDDPEDREGWLRLARSYCGSGPVPEQIDALFAAALDLADDQLVIYLAEVILQSGQSEIYAGRIGSLLDQLAPAAQTSPQWLFFRGHYAMSEGRFDLPGPAGPLCWPPCPRMQSWQRCCSRKSPRSD